MIVQSGRAAFGRAFNTMVLGCAVLFAVVSGCTYAEEEEPEDTVEQVVCRRMEAASREIRTRCVPGYEVADWSKCDGECHQLVLGPDADLPACEARMASTSCREYARHLRDGIRWPECAIDASAQCAVEPAVGPFQNNPYWPPR